MKNCIIITIMAMFFSLSQVFATSSTYSLPECCKNNEACCTIGAACCAEGKTRNSSDCCEATMPCCEEGASCCLNKKGAVVTKKLNKKQSQKGATNITNKKY